MPRHVIERTLPGAGKLSHAELRNVSAKSAAVVRELGPDVQWVTTFVTGDKLYCVYNAKDPALIREHAKRGGFPCDRVSEVKAEIDPTWGE